MRQVPYYLIIGSGRMATHMGYYLSLLQLPFKQWTRKTHTLDELTHCIQWASHVLLLVNDASIASFVELLKPYPNKVSIHFSGQRTFSEIHSAHPLMTFTYDLYDSAFYATIPFVIEKEGPAFSALLPAFPNPHYMLSKHDKTFYHALCVIGGNFTAILWQKVFYELQHTLQLPKEVMLPYLAQLFQNIAHNPESALTGPLVRNDQSTIQAHLSALQNDDFLEIYQTFVNFYQKVTV